MTHEHPDTGPGDSWADSPGLHLRGRRAAVVIVSTSAANGKAEDLCGPILHEWLTGLGLLVDPVRIVADGPRVETTLRELLESAPAQQRPRVVITSGGTGLNSDDVTPETTARLLDRQTPGIMHALWAKGLEKTPTAVMSRGVAGHAGATFVVNMPGSKGGVKDAMVVLEPLLEHISAQLEDVHGHAENEPRTPQARTVDADRGPAASQVLHASVGADPLDAERARAAVVAADCGAVVGFSGVIRNHDGERHDVTGLEYSAHPDATAVIGDVARDIAERFPGVRLWAEHRTGALRVGDSALEVAAAAAHRKAAFEACDALVESIKSRVPIWKRQTYTDGTHSWVGLDS